MDLDTLSLSLSAASACGTWVVAFALIGVGVIPVRKAYGLAGYLLAAGGAALFFRSLCYSVPDVLIAAEQFELVSTAGRLFWMLASLADLGALALVLAGLTLLARTAVAKGAAA